MSLVPPQPSSSSSPSFPHNLSPQELASLDAPLIALVQQCRGDLRTLLTAVFSFLHRRTDFYVLADEQALAAGQASMGFRPGDAEKLLLASFRQFPLRKLSKKTTQARNDKNDDTVTTTKKENNNDDRDSKSKESKDQVTVKKQVTATTHDDKKSTSAESKEAPSSSRNALSSSNGKHSTQSSSLSSSSLLEGIKYNDKGLQIPVGNGGSADHYKWTQTLEECTVLVPIDPDKRAKDLIVQLKPQSILVQNKSTNSNKDKEEKSPRVYMQGSLTELIVPDESTWTLEGGIVTLLLYKKRNMFWKSVLVGDPEIDTTLVDSRRHVSSYDESTQAQIRKIIHEQSQARKHGQPDPLANLPPIPTDTTSSTKTTISANAPLPERLPPGVEYIDQSVLDKAQQQVKEKKDATNDKESKQSGKDSNSKGA